MIKLRDEEIEWIINAYRRLNLQVGASKLAIQQAYNIYSTSFDRFNEDRNIHQFNLENQKLILQAYEQCMKVVEIPDLVEQVNDYHTRNYKKASNAIQIFSAIISTNNYISKFLFTKWILLYRKWTSLDLIHQDKVNLSVDKILKYAFGDLILNFVLLAGISLTLSSIMLTLWIIFILCAFIYSLVYAFTHIHETFKKLSFWVKEKFVPILMMLGFIGIIFIAIQNKDFLKDKTKSVEKPKQPEIEIEQKPPVVIGSSVLPVDNQQNPTQDNNENEKIRFATSPFGGFININQDASRGKPILEVPHGTRLTILLNKSIPNYWYFVKEANGYISAQALSANPPTIKKTFFMRKDILQNLIITDNQLSPKVIQYFKIENDKAIYYDRSINLEEDGIYTIEEGKILISIKDKKYSLRYLKNSQFEITQL